MKIGIIGAGRMGSALIEGFLRAGIKPKQIFVNEKDKAKTGELEKKGVKVVSKEELLSCDFVFVAVKPKEIGEVLEEFPREYQNSLISVAAGVRLERFAEYKRAKLFRIMPNIFCAKNEGAIALACRNADEKDIIRVEELLSKLGRVVRVEEEVIEVVTALSGSGPAFFSFLLDAMVEEAERLGLSREVALELGAQTLKGLGVAVLEGEDPKKIIEKVASPGGTTEAGLRVLKPARDLMRKTVRKAFERADQLCSGK